MIYKNIFIKYQLQFFGITIFIFILTRAVLKKLTIIVALARLCTVHSDSDASGTIAVTFP